MIPFDTLQSAAICFDDINIDTDMLLPKQFLRTIQRTGLGQALMYGERRSFEEAGDTHPLDDPALAGRRILVAGENFGCGSSREHAVWALCDYGIAAVIAPSFGSIFEINCANNGLLCAQLSRCDHDTLMDHVRDEPKHLLRVDLTTCMVSTSHWSAPFSIDEHVRRDLLEGVDSISRTLLASNKINVFEDEYSSRYPWLA
ncbi:3-isopropylmalate dehydratase small subunit [Agrobacterium tumefaciens]|uniref:3-isopropylmalate dehydratase small subunit n=1 Tax=Agrobacterium tumefaciens TaxID=358 RepID=UPI0018863879